MTAPARPVGGRSAPLPVKAAKAAGKKPGSRSAPTVDRNEVWLTGAVVRPPKFNAAEGLTEFTVAGHSPTSSGKVLPWYHKVLVDRATGEGLVAGMPVQVVGELDHQKFQVPGGKVSSVVRVFADRVKVLVASKYPVSEVPLPDGGVSFILDGGFNEVRLAGNLAQDAEQFGAPGGDPYARIQLAVEGRRGGKKKKNYFLLKAWRELVGPVGKLKAGARLGLRGVLLSESYLDGWGRKRHAVVVEIVQSKTRQ